MSQDLVSGIWAVHLLSVFYMTGLIWFVQVVHYPLMNRVQGAAYTEFQRAHMRRTTWVVGPIMLLEAGTAAALLYAHPPFVPFSAALLNMLLLLLIWISTAVWQVPCHGKLVQSFNAQAHRKLVRTNAVRTALWTARSVMWLVLLWRAQPTAFD